MKFTKKKTKNSKISFDSLFKWNAGLAIIYALQGAIILIISTSRAFPITTSFLTLNPIESQSSRNPVLSAATRHLFDINIVYLMAVFLFISAIAYGLIATVYRNKYEAGLKKGINHFRWIEYGFSASIMLVSIGLISGISDLSTLILIFALTLIMGLLGLATEVYKLTKNTNWLSYAIGCIAGLVPWIIFAVYLIGTNVYGSGHVPAFVYWIYFSLLILFVSFALNSYLQYTKKAKWSSYLYGERVYMILSLIAKTALAWQIFGGILRG